MGESIAYGVMDQYAAVDQGEDECGIHPMGSTRSDRSDRDAPGMVRHNVLSDRIFTTPESRQLSFQNWPQYLKQQPDTLAQAGFYYIGQSDHVKCFYCSLGLRDWEDDDCPWKEHAKFSPSCSFMRLSKGDDFIQRAVMELRQQEQAMYHPEEDEPRSPIHSQFSCCSSNSEELVSMGSTCPSSPRSLSSLTSSKSSSPVAPSAPGASPRSSPSSPSSKSSSSVAPSAPGAPPAKVLSLEDENERLRDEKLCKICWTAQVGVTFIPCGHFVCCVNCSLALSSCPLCRRKIDGSVRTFMS